MIPTGKDALSLLLSVGQKLISSDKGSKGEKVVCVLSGIDD